ncbi:MAG: hypothetical protein ACOY0T_19565 [Myxococcota bacterium]
MTLRASKTGAAPAYLNVFCSRCPDAWRVHAVRLQLPRYLQHCFDKYGEAVVAYLDFEDLDRHADERGVEIEKCEATTGSVELTARGNAVRILGEWLASAFSSGVRGPNSDADHRSG